MHFPFLFCCWWERKWRWRGWKVMVMMRYGVTLKYELIRARASPDTYSSSLLSDMDRGRGCDSTLYMWQWWVRRLK